MCIAMNKDNCVPLSCADLPVISVKRGCLISPYYSVLVILMKGRRRCSECEKTSLVVFPHCNRYTCLDLITLALSVLTQQLLIGFLR